MSSDDDGAPPLPRAIAVVVQRAGRCLLIQRAHHQPLGGYWTPVTGRLEPGETLEAACHREVAEEVGLRIELGPSFHAGTTSDGRFALTYFTAEWRGGELSLQHDEVADARWVSPAEVEAEALQPMLPTTRAVLAKAFRSPQVPNRSS